MILIRRFLTIFSTLAILGLFELLFWQLKLFYLIIFLLALVVVSIIIGLTRGKIESKEIWPLLIPSFFFIGFGFIFLFFIEGLIFQQLFIIAIVLLWWIFIENTFLFLHQPVRYQPYALENITAYLNIMTIFFMGASFYSIIIFLGFPAWVLIIFIYAVTFLLITQTIWINKLTLRGNFSLVTLLTILVSEMFWVENFLPTSYLVNGILLTLTYYFLTNIVRHWLMDSLDRRVFKRYFLISGIVTLMVVLTARWT